MKTPSFIQAFSAIAGMAPINSPKTNFLEENLFQGIVS